MLFQLEHTSVFFPVSPANEFAAFHTNWIRVPFSLSWIFQDSFLPELHAEITAFATKSGSSVTEFWSTTNFGPGDQDFWKIGPPTPDQNFLKILVRAGNYGPSENTLV